MSVEENNKALVRKFFEEVWSKGNVAAVDEFLAPDFVVHDTLSREEGGTEDYKRAVAEQIAASSDFHVSIEEQIAEGDKVVTRHVDSGTHDQEEFEGFAPSGARITMENITINRVVYTGQLLHHPFSDKRGVLKGFLDEAGLNLDGSVGVGDTLSDVGFLELVQTPIVFNPNRRLFDVARQQDWPIVVERKDVIYNLQMRPKDSLLSEGTVWVG